MSLDLDRIERSIAESEKHIAECSGTCCLCGVMHHICEPFAETIRDLLSEIRAARVETLGSCLIPANTLSVGSHIKIVATGSFASEHYRDPNEETK